MESIITKIRALYKELGPAEKRVADYILENTREIPTSAISELAKKCSCGDATLVRFSRRLGFDGFQGLKIRLATELGAYSTVSHEINKNDNCYEILCKQNTIINETLQSTQNIIDAEKLEDAAKSIMNAERISVFGLGNSASIATDFAHKLLRLGLNAQSCCDNHLQAIIASHLNRKSIAIGISHSGSSKDIVEALELSKIGGAKTICITNYGITPIIEVSDICLFTKADETSHSILALSSRLAQLAIIDAIYSYIVINSDKASMQAIYNTEYSLQDKKY